MKDECKEKCWVAQRPDEMANAFCTDPECGPFDCPLYKPMIKATTEKDMVNHPKHYAGDIEVIDYIRDKLTVVGFTEYCCGNVLKYISRWRKKDGVQDLKKAQVYLGWMIRNAELEEELNIAVPGDELI